jgi:hypothetical protein
MTASSWGKRLILLGNHVSGWGASDSADGTHSILGTEGGKDSALALCISSPLMQRQQQVQPKDDDKKE